MDSEWEFLRDDFWLFLTSIPNIQYDWHIETAGENKKHVINGKMQEIP